MCGICGIAGEGAEAAQLMLDRMSAALRHRGPDDSGQAGLKVALSGLGGDELFGGYETFRSAPLGAWIARNLPGAVRKPTGRLLKSSGAAAGPLQSEVEAGIAEPARALEPFFDCAAVRQVWHDFLGRRTSWSRPWSLYVLNQWARRYLDESSPVRNEDLTAEPARGIGGRR